MTVYVDTGSRPLGRMKMAHMVADTENELHAMADRIGVARRHFQGDHYDICKAKKAEAMRLGAVEVRPRELARLVNRGHRFKVRRSGCRVCSVCGAGEPMAKYLGKWCDPPREDGE